MAAGHLEGLRSAGEFQQLRRRRAQTLSGRIETGRRLIGRETRLGRLRSALDRVRDERRPRVVGVTGLPGVGKSAMLGGFIDQLDSRVLAGTATAEPGCAPYTAIGALLDSLADALSRRAAVRDKDSGYEGYLRAIDTTRTGDRSDGLPDFAELLGPCADVLIDLAPSWEPLLADQNSRRGRSAEGVLLPEPEALGKLDAPGRPEAIGREVSDWFAYPARARNRVRLALRRVFDALRDTVVVLVLDDAQHADRHSVEALRELLDGPVLLVVAFPGKDPELLRGLLDDAAERGAAVTVDLRPLPDTAVTELVAGVLGRPLADAQPLAALLVARTGSNPLAVGQLLHWLAEQGAITMDRDRGRWTWQLEKVTGLAPSPARTATLVQSRLNRFDQQLRDLLRAAAALRGPFSVGDLLRAGASGAHLADRLRRAVRAEMLRPVPAATQQRYEWIHPLVRQAVWDGLPAAERALASAALLEGVTMDAREVARLDEVDATVLDPVRLAELHHEAAGIAARRGAIEVADTHLRAAISVAPESGWAQRYPLMFELHLEAGQAARTAGDHEASRRFFGEAVNHARSRVDRARAQKAQLVLGWTRHGYGGDPAPGLTALRLLGVQLPPDDGDWVKAADEAVTEIHTRLSEVELSTTPMTDERARTTSALIADMLPSVTNDPDRCAVLAARGVRLALDYGPGPGTGYVLAWLGAAIDTRLGDEDAARECAETALALADEPYAAATRVTVALALPFLVGSPGETLGLLREAHLLAVEQGDAGVAMSSLLLRPTFLLALGASLDEVAEELASSSRQLGRFSDFPVGQMVADNVAVAVGRLRGHLDDSTRHPSALDEQSWRGELGYASTVHLSTALMSAYLLGEHGSAVHLAETAAAIKTPHWARFLDSERRFYQALAIAARFGESTPRQRREWTVTIAELQRDLERWAGSRPAGFAHKALLVSAEQARLAGDLETAMSRYDRVIGGARENGFPHVEAIAAELGGRCALEHSGAADADAYLRRARTCYQRWGARVKVLQLDRLLDRAPAPVGATQQVDRLDLITVVKAFQTLSAELDLDKLTATMLELLVHHSGAQRGALLLPDEAGRLRVAAEAVNDSDVVEVTLEPGGDLGARIPTALVEEARRSRGLVIGGHGDDPYLKARHPRAYLAAPIAHHGSLIGVLYLEHRHRTDAFGPGQVGGLEVLCGQAAISLDNARMYARLSEANRILDATFERLPLGLIVLRPDLTVHRASPHAVELLGLPIAPGTPIVELIDVLTPVNAKGQIFSREPALGMIGDQDAGLRRDVVILRPDGKRLLLGTWSIPLRDHHGHLLGVTLLVTDSHGDPGSPGQVASAFASS